MTWDDFEKLPLEKKEKLMLKVIRLANRDQLRIHKKADKIIAKNKK